MKQETLKTLEKLLIALAVMDFKKEAKEKIQNCLKEVKEEINYNRCCKSDSEQLPKMRLEQAIEKAKQNMDKIKDVDKHIDNIR